MAHFAEINEDSFVQQVIVVNNEVLLDEDGNESEALGVKFCEETFGGRWVQTSYNGNFRVAFAGAGSYYNERLDAFVSPEV
jgi:hypothetical protein